MRALRGTELKRFIRGLERPAKEIALVLHDVEDPVNVGAAFRIADAAKVASVWLCGITPRPPHKLIDKVGRKKDKRVPWRSVDAVGEAIRSLKEDGYTILALELADGAQSLYARDYPERVAIVVGHEDHGVTKAALEACDGAVYIPMYGKGASLNVSVALGIAAFQVLHGDVGPSM